MMRIASVIPVTLVLVSAASAQSFKTRSYPEFGLPTFQVPRSFVEIPVQPGEQWIRLLFKEKVTSERGRGAIPRKLRPEMRVVVIPKIAPSTGAGSQSAGGSKEKQDKGPRKEPIVNLSSYLTQRMGSAWKLESLGPGKRNRNFSNQQYELQGPSLFGRGASQTFLAGYSYVWETASANIALIGICHPEDYAELSKLWKRVGDRMKVAEPEESAWANTKLERYYRRKKFTHIDYRLRVRAALVEGWQAEDTENFIVVFHTSDQPLLRKVLRDLELLRLEYMRLFPPAEDFDAVSTVRICADRAEYMAYGGSAGSVGYWNSKTEELVLFDAEKHERGKRSDDSDTFVVLYHEAFHQYIHYSTGELPPHSWFNEGYGDYFSGATIKNGKVRKIGVNPWRVRLIHSVVTKKIPSGPVPWKDIIHYSQREYYSNPGPRYAQGWSMIYFLNTSKVVQDKKEWAAILPTYFTTLKESYGAELEARAEALSSADGGQEAREAAGSAAREAAVEAAFEHVDLTKIDRAWKAFVEKLDFEKK